MHNAGGLLGPRGLAVPLAAEYEYDYTSGSRSQTQISEFTKATFIYVIMFYHQIIIHAVQTISCVTDA